MGPPDDACFDLSLRVRSGLMAVQLMPPSALLNTTWAPWYSVPGSSGEMAMGAVHWKRYFRSTAP